MAGKLLSRSSTARSVQSWAPTREEEERSSSSQHGSRAKSQIDKPESNRLGWARVDRPLGALLFTLHSRLELGKSTIWPVKLKPNGPAPVSTQWIVQYLYWHTRRSRNPAALIVFNYVDKLAFGSRAWVFVLFSIHRHIVEGLSSLI